MPEITPDRLLAHAEYSRCKVASLDFMLEVPFARLLAPMPADERDAALDAIARAARATTAEPDTPAADLDEALLIAARAADMTEAMCERIARRAAELHRDEDV